MHKLWKYVKKRFNLTKSEIFALIEEGKVLVDGRSVNDPYYKLTEGSKVFVEGQYFMFNKPKGYVVSRQEKGKKVIYDILPEYLHTYKPVGRLDMMSKGLLVLTTDNFLIHRMTHPKFRVPRGYVVKLNEDFKRERSSILLEGVGKLRASKVVPYEDIPDELSRFVEDDEYSKWVLVELEQGKFHEVRRLFRAVGYRVEELKRIYFGKLILNVKEGDLRELLYEELSWII